MGESAPAQSPIPAPINYLAVRQQPVSTGSISVRQATRWAEPQSTPVGSTQETAVTKARAQAPEFGPG